MTSLRSFVPETSQVFEEQGNFFSSLHAMFKACKDAAGEPDVALPAPIIDAIGRGSAARRSSSLTSPMPPPRPQSATLSPGSDGSASSAVRGGTAVSVGAAAGAARTAGIAAAAAPLPAEVPAAGASYLVRAVADFAAAEPGDLSVATDDLVLVTGEVSTAGVSLCSCVLLFLLALVLLLLCLRSPVYVCVCVSACHCRCRRVGVPARCCGDGDGACVVLLVGS
jgi:hypothetical protein